MTIDNAGSETPRRPKILSHSLGRCAGFRYGRTPLVLCLLLLVRLPAVSAQEPPDSIDGPAPAVDPGELRLGRETVVAPPGRVYEAGRIHRWFMGDLNRALWKIPVTAPVLDLDSVGGGLTVDELSGGSQTLGIRFSGADGLIYQFRSIVKDASRAVPGALRSTPVDDIWQDQMAAQNPMSALVVAEILRAADVLVAQPRLVVMPDDPRLGEFRDAFAGLMGWIEIRPNEREGNRPGFAGSSKIVGTEELYDELRSDPTSFINQRDLLKARLIDMFVGDWDRHEGQWRWARYQDDGRSRWDPIPRDRDWALNRLDGLLPRVAGIFYPKYVGWSGEMPSPRRIAWSAQKLDRALLSSMDRETARQVALDLHARLDEALLQRAVEAMPESYQAAIGDEMLDDLRARRAEMLEFAEDYYAQLARWTEVWGSDFADSLHIQVLPEGGVSLELWTGESPVPRLDSRFLPEDRAEIRIHLFDGDDVVVAEGSEAPRIDLRIVGGDGADRVQAADGVGINFYDSPIDAEIGVEGDVSVETTEFDHRYDEDYEVDLIWEPRDWGREWLAFPLVSYTSDVGLMLGGGVRYYEFGFRRRPFKTRIDMRVMKGVRPEQSEGIANYLLPRVVGDFTGRLSFGWTTDHDTRFFGYGNESAPTIAGPFYNASRTAAEMRGELEGRVSDNLRVWFGSSVRFFNAISQDSSIFAVQRPYGSDRFGQLRFDVGGLWTVLDSAGAGLDVELEGRFAPPVFDLESAYGSARSSIRGRLRAPLPLQPELSVRVSGEQAWGRVPYAEAASLGGGQDLLGYRYRRYIGDRSLSAMSIGRLRLLKLDQVSGLRFGLQGIAGVGRVWLEGEDSDLWHTSLGGGIWVRSEGLGKFISFSLIQGDRGMESYLSFGGLLGGGF